MDEYVKSILLEKKKEAEIYRYYILKSLGVDIPEIEEFETSDENVFMKTYLFKENFFRLKGLNPIEHQLSEYREEALHYLECSYPFCFNIDLDNELMGMGDDKTCLSFYAMCLGATDEQIDGIEELLASQPLKTIDANKTIKFQSMQSANAQNKEIVDLGQICGSTVEKYRGSNLLEVYEKANDKLMQRYIIHVLKSGGMGYSTRVFDNMAVGRDDEGNYFISEGNHRVVAYQALKAVKEYITGKKEPSIQVPVSVSRISYIEDRGYEEVE